MGNEGLLVLIIIYIHVNTKPLFRVCMDVCLLNNMSVCVCVRERGGPLNRISGHTSSVNQNQSVPGWVSGPVWNHNTNMRADWSILQSLCTSAELVWHHLGCRVKEDFVLQLLRVCLSWFVGFFKVLSVHREISLHLDTKIIWNLEAFPNIQRYGSGYVSLGSGWVEIIFPSSSIKC